MQTVDFPWKLSYAKYSMGLIYPNIKDQDHEAVIF